MSALSADEPDTDKVVKWLEHNLGVHLLGWQIAALQRYRASQPVPRSRCSCGGAMPPGPDHHTACEKWEPAR